MTQDQKPRSGYQERLLSELRALAERNAAEAPAAPAGRRRVPPRLALAGVAGGACVASAAIAFTGGSGEGSTAYAVEPRDDGTVIVEISRLEDADGLEQELRAAGVPAEVDFLPLDRVCREPRFTQAPRGEGKVLGGVDTPVTLGMVGDGSAPFRFPIRTGSLRPGETLVVMGRLGTHPRSDPPQVMTTFAVAVAKGDVAPCDPVPARAPNLESEETPAKGAPAD